MHRSAVRQSNEDIHLLLDEAAVAAASGCRLQFCPAAKDPASPILTATENWEGQGPYTWCSRILYLPESSKYRMYYMSFQEEGNHYRTNIAESADGLHWEKPAHFHTEYEGQPCSYAMETEGFGLGKPARSATYDPRPECPPEEKYKSIAFSYDGVNVFFSPDGIHWRGHPQNPVWKASSDIIHCIWDDWLQKFVVYFKLWKLQALVKDDDAPNGCREITAHYVFFDPTELADGWTELSGRRVYFRPDAAATVRDETICVRSGSLSSDDGGGGHLSGAWSTKRVVCRAESHDFIHWEKEQEVLSADDQDRPDANIQIAQVFTMGGYYLAFLTMHDQRGHFDQQLAFSTDGIHWKRPWRGNLISHGAPGRFDHGMVTQPADPIITETQMLLYYGGSTGSHVSHGSLAIGRAMLRRDGFACWRSCGDSVGQLTTVPFFRKNDALYLNADAEGGWITAALLDEDGRIIPGFTHENCIAIREDSASHPACAIRVCWYGQAGLPAGNHFSIALRFQNAAIYSIRI